MHHIVVVVINAYFWSYLLQYSVAVGDRVWHIIFAQFLIGLRKLA